MNNFVQELASLVPATQILVQPADTQAFLIDQRGRAKGAALAITIPNTVEEVAHIVRYCASKNIPIVPQGGNTGLVLGSIPDTTGNSVIVSTRKLNKIRQIDSENNCIVLEAGCILQDVQNIARAHNRLFPLSLASEGSCTIGGNLASNAGGTAVLRYGNARELCLGLEVVLPNGEIWSGLNVLRKNNTGYDLKNLFIGAEGTLGIITAASLRLFPEPMSYGAAMLAVPSCKHAVELLQLCQANFGPTLTGFELISDYAMKLVQTHMPECKPALPTELSPYFALVEISHFESSHATQSLLSKTLEFALSQGLINDAVIAQNETQRLNFWKVRESISPAQARDGANIKHDISLPISRIPEFIDESSAQLNRLYPGVRIVCFGHLGDGNLHFNVSAPTEVDSRVFIIEQPHVNHVIYEIVHKMGGSISAEHGIGALKRDELIRYKSALEMQLMRQIKSTFDPNNIMNPGKVL